MDEDAGPAQFRQGAAQPRNQKGKLVRGEGPGAAQVRGQVLAFQVLADHKGPAVRKATSLDLAREVGVADGPECLGPVDEVSACIRPPPEGAVEDAHQRIGAAVEVAAKPRSAASVLAKLRHQLVVE
jgi:hypothetical protein